jgi:hypothetical protein
MKNLLPKKFDPLFAVILAILLVFLSANPLSSGRCTQKDIIKMIEKGYSNSEIYDICKESPEGIKCCCECELYVETSFFGRGEMKYEETSYKWRDAQDCQTRTYYFFFIQKREAVRQCVSDNNCEN